MHTNIGDLRRLDLKLPPEFDYAYKRYIESVYHTKPVTHCPELLPVMIMGAASKSAEHLARVFNDPAIRIGSLHNLIEFCRENNLQYPRTIQERIDCVLYCLKHGSISMTTCDAFPWSDFTFTHDHTLYQSKLHSESVIRRTVLDFGNSRFFLMAHYSSSVLDAVLDALKHKDSRVGIVIRS